MPQSSLYYLIAPLGANLQPLTYKSTSKLTKGAICEISLRNKPCLGVVLESCKKPSFKCVDAKASKQYFLAYQQILAQFIAQYYCVELGIAYSIFTPATNIDTKLDSISISAPNALSKAQNGALEFIKSKPLSLLFGDTGSGKTEIYMHLIASVLESRQNALFLMPEIALTPQIEARLTVAFGDMVGIWHSKITKKKKQDLLKCLEEGKIRVIAGARSALFLPIRHLGLIIIDEEHDDAYKSSQNPRYNARDVALYLGKECGIKVVLGSATPSLTSYYHAKNKGYLYRLKGRYFNSKKHITIAPPHTELEADSNEVINSEVIAKIKATLSKNQQCIVFLPTRAHYKMLLCKSCGSGVECAFCSVNMSLHLDKNAMICHYCNFTKPLPKRCEVCGEANLSSYRIGTAQVAKMLESALPSANIAIFDRDNITTHNKLTKTLKAFNVGKIDVLIGTQMLSKGHDYHNVRLVVVLGIDFVLKSSYYRASERAISLVHQIAGRSARKYDGEVYIQSDNVAFLRQFVEDYAEFLESELSLRPRIYPPYTRLATLTFANKIESRALQNMQKVLDILRANLPKDVEIVGDTRALLKRLYDKFRFIILLRSDSTNALLKALHLIHSNKDLNMLCEIDIDPLSVI